MTDPKFETSYEFVDTNPIHSDDSSPLQCVHEKDNVTEPPVNSEIANVEKHSRDETNRVEKLKNFKCSICLKKFRKLSDKQTDSMKYLISTITLTANIEYIEKHLVKIHSLEAESQNYKNHLELSNCDSEDELDDNVKCYICGKSYGQ